MSRDLPWIGEPVPEVIARPKCPSCQKPLRPYVVTKEARTVEPTGFHMKPVSREWTGRYQCYGAFCSLRCGASFANAAYKAGYRKA